MLSWTSRLFAGFSECIFVFLYIVVQYGVLPWAGLCFSCQHCVLQCPGMAFLQGMDITGPQ